MPADFAARCAGRLHRGAAAANGAPPRRAGRATKAQQPPGPATASAHRRLPIRRRSNGRGPALRPAGPGQNCASEFPLQGIAAPRTRHPRKRFAARSPQFFLGSPIDPSVGTAPCAPPAAEGRRRRARYPETGAAPIALQPTAAPPGPSRSSAAEPSGGAPAAPAARVWRPSAGHRGDRPPVGARAKRPRGDFAADRGSSCAKMARPTFERGAAGQMRSSTGPASCRGGAPARLSSPRPRGHRERARVRKPARRIGPKFRLLDPSARLPWLQQRPGPLARSILSLAIKPHQLVKRVFFPSWDAARRP